MDMGKIIRSFGIVAAFLSLSAPAVGQVERLNTDQPTAIISPEALQPDERPLVFKEVPRPVEGQIEVTRTPDRVLSPEVRGEVEVFRELKPEFARIQKDQVCCQVDEGVDQYHWQPAESCREHLVAPKERCAATGVKCCCARDDGPGAEGTWTSPSECKTGFCLRGEPDPSRRGDPNACIVVDPRIPKATYRIVPDASHTDRYERLRKLARNIGWTASALCAADRMQPGEKCRDVILCGVDSNGNVSCRACDGDDCIPWNPPGKPPTGNKTKGYPFASSCIWAPKGQSQYRNLMSRYLSGENTSDMQAKAFYSLAGTNTEVANKMVKVYNAMATIKKGPGSPVDNFTSEMLVREVNIGTLNMGPNPAYDKCFTHKQKCGNDNFCYVGVTVGNAVRVFYVDEYKRLYAETMDSDLTIFSQGLQHIKDAKMRGYVKEFLSRSALYVGNFLVVEHRKDPNLIDARNKEIDDIRNYLNNSIVAYAKQNP